MFFYKVEKVEAKQKALICDLGGIFFDLNTSGFIEAVGDGSTVRGVLNVLQYAVRDFKNAFKAIEDKFFETLDQFPLKAKEEGFKRHVKALVNDCLTHYAPIKQEESQQGHCFLWGGDAIDCMIKRDFFASEREEAIIRNVLKGRFNPEIHAKHEKPLTNALELLKEVASQVNEDGTKKYIIEGAFQLGPRVFRLCSQDF